MKKIFTLLLMVVLSNALFAQQSINFHKSSTVDSYQLNESDSLYFNEDHSIVYFSDDGNIIENALSDIDSITFTTNVSRNVYIEYLESTVQITNPLSGSGVSIQVNGANVVINSTSNTEEINYICSGATSNGSLKIYSDEKFHLFLNDLNITNPVGPAINIQSGERVHINLTPGSSNMLTDGAIYDAPVVVNGVEEDQKAVLFGEGKLIFVGSGSLTIQGLGEDQQGIRADKELNILEGDITISSSKNDGIHADGFVMEGGTATITSAGDGIDGDEDQIEIYCGDIIINSTSADVNGIVCDSTMNIYGGDITLNIAGGQSKGLKSGMDMQLNGGMIHGTASGNAVLLNASLGFDPSYSSLVKADANLVIDGANINFTTTGKGSRGISCNGNLTIQSGTITIVSSGNGATYQNSAGATDAYHGACIKADGNFTVIDGDIHLTNSGTGGKGISVDGDFSYGNGATQPEMDITTTGARITITGGGGGPGGGGGNYDESKALTTDGSITINSGIIQIASADDGMKSEESITINNGEVNILNSVEGVESPSITVNNGHVSVRSSDDGFNATNGSGGEQNDGSTLTINGGYCYVNSSGGDPMDSNGNIAVTGGTIVVHGPQSSPEVGMDVNGNATISGGFIIVSGTNSNMTEGFTSSSSQKSLIIKSGQSIASNTIIHLEDANGNDIFTFKPVRNYYSIVFSSSLLVNGSGYKLYTGGSSSGTETEGLYSGGTYTPGTLKKTFSITGTVTNVAF